MKRITLADIQNVSKIISSTVKRTPVLSNKELNEHLGGHIFLKCENFQQTGSFKFRGACNTVFNLSKTNPSGVATHSSGNHGQALALAAKIKGIPAHIVMPKDAPQVKRRDVKGYGAQITLCEPSQKARESTLQQVVAETGATFIHPYDNPNIIAGQGTASMELVEDHPDLDLILAPVSGGGLLSGTAIAAKNTNPNIDVVGCEPELANDAFLSLQSGKRQPAKETTTIADALRSALSDLTFRCIKDNVDAIVTLSEKQIIEAMRFSFEQLKMVIEPSSAVTLAAILYDKIDVQNKKVGAIISGGNVDLDRLPW